MKKAKKPINFFVWLRSSLRKISQRHPPIYEALAAAKRPYVGDNPRQKVCYQCAKCKGLFSAKQVAVDHREECGVLSCWEDVQGFMQRLFCEKDGLDILCHTCHDIKTYMFKHGVTEDEATLEKELIAIFKNENKDDIVQFILDYDWHEEYNVNNEANRKAAVRSILKGVN